MAKRSSVLGILMLVFSLSLYSPRAAQASVVLTDANIIATHRDDGQFLVSGDAGWFLRPFGVDSGVFHGQFIRGSDPAGAYSEPPISLYYGLNQFVIMGADKGTPSNFRVELNLYFNGVGLADGEFLHSELQAIGATSGSTSLRLTNGDVVTLSNFKFDLGSDSTPTTYGPFGPPDGSHDFLASVTIGVPEPVSLGLFGAGLGLLAVVRRRRAG